jgi:deoxycytidine triphosphate deaminase
LSQNETTHCDKTDVIADDDGNLDFCAGSIYSVETLEYAKIPENSVAMVYGRSTLNRNGILIRSSLYDSGFENYIGFTMYAFSGLRTQVGVRLAQIVFYPAEYSRLYNGQYMTNALPMRGA